MYRVELPGKTELRMRMDFPLLEDAVRAALRLRHLSYDVEIVDPETGEPVEM